MLKLEDDKSYQYLQACLAQAREREKANNENIKFIMKQINEVKREFYHYELDRQS